MGTASTWQTRTARIWPVLPKWVLVILANTGSVWWIPLLLSFPPTGGLPCSFAALALASLRQWFLPQRTYTYPVRLWEIDGLTIGWANHGICNGNITVHILEWLFYRTIGQWRNPLAAMGSNDCWQPPLDTDATALMQGGKQYENLSEGLCLYRLDYVATGSFCSWFTCPYLLSFWLRP
jgi:hypothetical protein